MKELNGSKYGLMQGTFDITKSRISKNGERKDSDEIRSSNDSGCSVDSSCKTTQPKDLRKPKCSESQAKKDNACSNSNGEPKKKNTSPRFTLTQSRKTQITTTSKTSSSNNQTENTGGPKSVSVVGKTLGQTEKTNSQDASVPKKTSSNSNNTHVAVVKAPKDDTSVRKYDSSNVPNICSTTDSKSSSRSTYQTTRTAPSVDKNLSSNENSRTGVTDACHAIKTASKVHNASKTLQSSNPGSQGVQACGGSKYYPIQRNNTQNSLQKGVAPPRPVAPPRQNTNLAKAKSQPKLIKKENSVVTNKLDPSNTGPSNKASVSRQQSKLGTSKPVVPPRPQSVASGSAKQEIPQTGPKARNSVNEAPSLNHRTQNSPVTKKPTTAPSDACRPEKQTVVIAVNSAGIPETVVKDSIVPANEGKRQPPVVPPRPRSMKAKLIKVASSESLPKDLKSTYVVEKEQTENEQVQRKKQQPTENSICTITINGKDSTIPEYNLKSKEVQNRKDCSNGSVIDSPLCERKMANPDKVGSNQTQNSVNAVKVVKIDSSKENAVEPTGAKFVPRPETSEHDGPVIWDPFEKIREQNQKSSDCLDVKEEDGKPRVKSAKCSSNRLTVPGSRKLSAKNRNNSASKRNVKVRPVVEANKSWRPKSPKKKGTKKKKKDPNGGKDLTNRVDQENVTFVSGIGWHLDYDQTPTFTKVRPFKFKPPGDYSSEEDDYSHTPRVLPDYSTGISSKRTTPRSFHEVDTLLPNMAVSLEELEEYTSDDESDDEDYVEAENVVDDIAEFKHPRDNVNDDESSVSEENSPSKQRTKISLSNYQSSKLPHVAQATKITMERTDLGDSQKVEAKVIPDIENVKRETQEAETKPISHKVIAVRSAEKENKLKISSDSSQPKISTNVNCGGLSPNRNGKKQVSNPISPGASVPERRPSFSKPALLNERNSENCAEKSQSQQEKVKSIRVEKTVAKPKHEPLALSEDVEADKKYYVRARKTPHKSNTKGREKQIKEKEENTGESRPINVLATEKGEDNRNSKEDLENIIDEIIKNTPNPTISFKSNEGEVSKDKKPKQKKHSRERFEREMRGSHGGKAFRQVIERSYNFSTFTKTIQKFEMITSRYQFVLLKVIYVLKSTK